MGRGGLPSAVALRVAEEPERGDACAGGCGDLACPDGGAGAAAEIGAEERTDGHTERRTVGERGRDGCSDGLEELHRSSAIV